MKIAFIVDTPFQLMNAINISLSKDINCDKEIYIINQFKNALTFAENVKNTGAFSSVYVVPREKRGALKHLWTIIGIAFPSVYAFLFVGRDFLRKHYDEMYIATPTKLVEFMIFASKAKVINGIDDGTASYFGDLYSDRYSKKYKVIKSLFNRDYSINYLYLNSPNLYNGHSVNASQIKQIRNDNIDILKIVFNVKESQTPEVYNVLYFNQPLEDIDPTGTTEKKVIEALKNVYRDRTTFAVRLHPRETKSIIYRGLYVDNTEMWEVSCPEIIDENSVLISAFSTALLTPFLLYGIQPHLVFTYKLYDSFDEKTIEGFTEMVEFLKNNYSDPNKIEVVNNIEEFHM